MAVITPNGHIDPNDENPFEGRYNRVKAEARAFNAETERRKAEMNRERDELNEERKQAMMRASEHAGSLGLIYKPRLNSFNRVVIVDDLPSLAGDRPAFTEVDLTTEPPTIPASSEPSDAPIEPEATETVVATEPVAKPTITQNFRTLLTQRPAQPEAPPRPEVPKPQETDKKWHRNASIKSAIAWIASLFVGFFVGFGLLSLTGLPYKRSGDWVNLYGFLLLGVAAIVGMKLLFDAMWHEAGRRKGLKTSEWQYSAICTLVSLAILSVEATLGGTALAYYTKKASFQNEGGLPLSLMVLLAVAVSTANLLFSAFIGYQKGLRSVTHEDIQNRIYELDVKEREATKEELLAQHQRDLEAWEAEVKREEEVRIKVHEQKLKVIEDHNSAHESALARHERMVDQMTGFHSDGVTQRDNRTDEFNTLAKLPDYQALCQYIGYIDTLNLRIEELDRRMTNESISRGYARKNSVL